MTPLVLHRDTQYPYELWNEYAYRLHRKSGLDRDGQWAVTHFAHTLRKMSLA